MKDEIALFDMDGTLFDHDRSLWNDMVKITSPEEILPVNIREWENFPWLKARMDMIRTQVGWWRQLPKYTPGWDILTICQEIGFCCQILTKGPHKKSLAWTEKVNCISDHLGEDFPVNIVGHSKKHTYGRVLVDDFPHYVLPWLKRRPRGLVIMPSHPYNEDFVHPNVIHYKNEDQLPYIRKVLQAVYDRENGQDWKELVPSAN